MLLKKLRNIYNENTLLIIEIKILTFWSPANEYDRCCSLSWKNFKIINYEGTLSILGMKILTRSMSGSGLVCSLDEQNPSSAL